MNLRHVAALAVAAFGPLAALAQTPLAVVYGTDTDRRDQFGSGAALLGDRLFVGAIFADLGLPCEACEPGAAYVFEQGGGTPWIQTARLSPVRVPADYRGPGLFGGEVDACAINGPDGPVTYLAVGAASESFGYEATGSPPPDSLFNGAVYVYRQVAGAEWALDRRLRDPSPRPRGYLGSGVALVCEGVDVTLVSTGDLGQFAAWHRDAETGAWSGGTSMSGGWGDNTDSYWIEGTTGGPNGVTPAVLTDRQVFRRSGGVESPWTVETTLPLPAVADQSRYTFIRGSIDGDWIVVSYLHNWTPFTDSRAYVYRYGGSGVGWVQDAEFRGIATERYFARATQIAAMPDGSVFVVITRGEGYGAAGTSPATLFRRTLGGTWAEIADVANASGGIRDMTSRRLVLTNQRSSARGADAGAAFVVDLTGVIVADEPTIGHTAAASVRVWPNPAAGAFQVSARVPGGGAVRMAAYDGLGRLVAVLGEGTVGEGTALVARVEAGRLAAGVYVVRAEGPGGASAAARVVVLR